MEEEKKAEVPAKFKEIVSALEKMTVLDLSELVKVLEDKFGVSAAAPMMAMAAPAAAAEPVEEKSTFDVELTEVGGNKVGVIKVIRELTALGLKEAKDITDTAPKVVLTGISKADAEAAKKKFEDAGAKVAVK
jgi:large subunit ribosomal protein L7/L12